VTISYLYPSLTFTSRAEPTKVEPCSHALRVQTSSSGYDRLGLMWLRVTNRPHC